MHAQIFQRENVKNTGIHKKLKIVFASSFKVYSELGLKFILNLVGSLTFGIIYHL
jgi:hypothetical protein